MTQSLRISVLCAIFALGSLSTFAQERSLVGTVFDIDLGPGRLQIEVDDAAKTRVTIETDSVSTTYHSFGTMIGGKPEIFVGSTGLANVRLGDRIRRRAENISSYEIEHAATTYSGVGECAAVGVASEFASDDDIKLVVVPHPNTVVIEPAALLAHLAKLLPHYMVPRYIEIVDAMPRTPTNKIRKAVLRENGVGPATWDRKAAGIALKELMDRQASAARKASA